MHPQNALARVTSARKKRSISNFAFINPPESNITRRVFHVYYNNPMKFYKLAQYLQQLEETTKRLEITDILADLIKKLNTDEIDLGLYLSLGYLKAPFESEKFNIADKMMIQALKAAYPNQKEQIDKMYSDMGDLGNVAYELNQKDETSDLTIKEVHQKLLKIALIEGTGSQDKKIKQLVELIHQLNGISTKYAVRIVLGTTRLGFTELTIADALSIFLKGNKSLKQEIESKYFIHPDIGLIAKVIKEKGIEGLKEVKMEPGIPVLSQKPQRSGGISEAFERLGTAWAEFKFDGTRVQLHMDKNKKVTRNTQKDLFGGEQEIYVKTFTRNLDESTHQHPDIIEAIEKQVDADSVIFDGEAIGVDKETGEFLPFQEIMQRKRKHSIKEMAVEIPLRYFVFDILYLNGESLIDRPLAERHKILSEVIKEGEIVVPTAFELADTEDKLAEYYEKAKELNLEGLIAKNPNDPYKAGARTYSWIKIKKADEKLLEDSVDAVVLGYYSGRGERAKFGIGAFLIAVYDKETETFKTVSKVGTGLKDDDWVYLKKEADKYKVEEVPGNVDLPKEYMPDVIVTPKIVVEVGADEISVSKTHSAGYALRFPRLLYFRTDKNAQDATTLSEIEDLHNLQKRGKYKK